MLDVNKLLEKAKSQASSVGIKLGNIDPEVIINKRAKTWFGRCKRVQGKYNYQIELNSLLLNSNEENIMNVLVHEILHTVKYCMNHGAIWTINAKIMNMEFGYDISTTTSYSQLGIKSPKAKYTIKCKGCGLVDYRYRKSKVITNINKYKCKTCKSSLLLTTNTM